MYYRTKKCTNLTMSRHKIGIILGRFEPPHPGHLYLIDQAIRDNDEVIIAIGSAQKANPLTAARRLELIKQALTNKYPVAKYKIIKIDDIGKPIGVWVKYVKEKLDLTNQTENNYYTAYKESDYLPGEKQALENNGFTIRYFPRIKFKYIGPDGKTYIFSHATEIRNLHKKLNKSLM